MADEQHDDQIMQKSITIEGNSPPESVWLYNQGVNEWVISVIFTDQLHAISI